MVEVKDNTAKERPLKSPCVSVCVLNDDDVCVGCYRTGQEITDWGGYTNEQRREVLVKVNERGKALNPFL